MASSTGAEFSAKVNKLGKKVNHEIIRSVNCSLVTFSCGYIPINCIHVCSYRCS